MVYKEFVLEALDYRMDALGCSTFKVRVLESDQGAQTSAEAPTVTIPADLEPRLRRLHRRELDPQELQHLGADLGRMLFPPEVLQLLRHSRRALRDGERLRIRLRLDDVALRRLPWELAWLPLEGDPGDQTGQAGFLALDSRVSLVRQEVIGQPASTALRPGGIARVLLVLSNPDDRRYAKLAVERERQVVETALQSLDLHAEVHRRVTRRTLDEALAETIDVFHFAGHGDFVEDDAAATGTGFVVLEGAEGGADLLSADELADKLSGCDVRLAVLGTCQGGRRDGTNPWSGVIPALVNKAGIPAVIGMQFPIRDRRAVAFAKKLYELLASGESIDAAVTAGRRAIRDGDCDWAAPVLYLRGQDGVLFPSPHRFTELVRRSGEQTRRFLDDVRDGIYHAQRYVNRSDAEATLWEFLEGDAAGLVLIGKAGCGKTNLLCHWTEELVEKGYPVFIYQCGLSIDSPIADAIKRDLAPRELRGPQVTLREVVERIVPEGRKLVLVFDGVNEFDHGDGPREILHEIDRIVGELRGHGVRVVLSCSQPTWEWLTLEHGVPVARGAYHWPNAGGEPLLLDEFTEEEVAAALDCYTEAYKLRTPLSKVRPGLRRRLRDPSLLRTFAESYADSAEGIGALRDTPLKIWEEYWRQRLRRERDMELVEVLAAEMLGRQQSALPVRELRAGPQELREALTFEAPDSPYRRLLDLGVLSRFRRADGPHWLKFASTRFAALVLARQLEKQREPLAEQLSTLIRSAESFPLAWEVACVLAQDEAQLEWLAASDEPVERKLAVEALTDLHDNYPDRAIQLIDQLVQQHRIEARRTGLAAAAAIGRDAKGIFLRAATSQSRVLAREAAYALYLACSSEPETIYGLLEEMRREVTPRLESLPLLLTPDSKKLLEFMAELSIAVHCNHCGLQGFAGRTSSLWEGILVEQLRLPELRAWWVGRVLQAPVKRILVTRMWRTAMFAERQSLRRFIELPDEDKDCFRRVIDLLEPDADPRPHEGDLAWLLDSEVFVCNVLAAMVIAVHSIADFERMEPFVRGLPEWLNDRGRLSLLLAFTVLLHDTPEAWVGLLEDLTRLLLDQHPEIVFGYSDIPLAAQRGTLLPLGLAYGKRRTEMPLLESLLRESTDQPERLARLLGELAPIGLYYPAELLRALRTGLPGLSDGRGMTDLVRESLVQSLGMIRGLHFDEVDTFLASVDPALPLVPMAYDSKLNDLPRYLLSVGMYNNAVHMALRYPRSRRALLMWDMRTLAAARNETSFLNQAAMKFLQELQAADYRMEKWTLPE